LNKQKTNEKIVYPVFQTENPRNRQEHGASMPRADVFKRLSNSATGSNLVGSNHEPLTARLSLKFVEDGGTVRLVERDHFGPLVVQKPFYPEGRDICHAVIVHPPGGVVGGDELEISVTVGASAGAQLTTPGATKWYKANGSVSRQRIKLNVGQGGSLEWVPQETIFFDNACVEIDHEVALQKEAIYIGCEILCFGRTASGESFKGGEIRQRISIRRDAELVWYEQLRLAGGSPAMENSLVLAGKTVCATLIAVGENLPAPLIASLREDANAIAGGETVGISQLKSALVVRYLGKSSETARRIMLRIWGGLRPAMLGRTGAVPRMWNT
jgi:urease accessory protein